MMSSTVSPNILIVEDNVLDAELTKWALAEAGFAGIPTVVNDGSDALLILRRQEPYQDSLFPDMVILDLNLKLVDGPEVLRFIRESPDLSSLTVAILSSTPEDVMRAKAAKANCYFSKSSSLDGYAEIGKKLLACYFASRRTLGEREKEAGSPSNAEHSPQQIDGRRASRATDQ